MAHHGSAARPRLLSTMRLFLLSRWRGEAPLSTLFWRDMLLVGTLVNVVTTLLALGMLAAEAPVAAVLSVFFSPVPYNLFLFFSVWRTAEKASGATPAIIRFSALAWLMAAIAI